MKTDFQTLKNAKKTVQTKEKHVDSDILLLKFRNYHDSESITETKAVLESLFRGMGTTLADNVFCHAGYAYIRIKM